MTFKQRSKPVAPRRRRRKKWCAAAADFLGPARRRRRDFTGAPPTHSSVIEFLIGKKHSQNWEIFNCDLVFKRNLVLIDSNLNRRDLFYQSLPPQSHRTQFVARSCSH